MTLPPVDSRLREATNLYAFFMAEIKVRIGAINAIGGTIEHRVPALIVREFCFLQFRMICELIALGCLTAHGDIKETTELRKSCRLHHQTTSSRNSKSFTPSSIRYH